jgi:preprotein translocase subunit SecF
MFNFDIIKNRKIYLVFSGILVALSIIALSVWGLNFGIDFTGGNLVEIRFNDKNPSVLELREGLDDLGLNSLIIQATDENSFILRFREDAAGDYRGLMSRLDEIALNLSELDEEPAGMTLVEELRFDSVGPSIGQELKSKSFNIMLLVLVVIVLYVALIFRKVSKPVSSWKYGITAIIALFHDVLIVLGIFAVLGKFYGTEINTPFIAAALTVLGYSVNDSIVVFDRIRENLPKSTENFLKTVNKSLNQVLVRSINTSFTTLLALLAIIFFGGESIREFILALAIGVFIGTYSSIFIASPILVLFDRRK